MLRGLRRFLWGDTRARPDETALAASKERAAFEKARLDYCQDVFNREEERREQLEKKAQFYLSFITLILGALFFKAENLTLLNVLIGSGGIAAPLITLTYATIILLGLSILFSVVAILGVTRLWSYRGPYPEDIVHSLFSPESNFIEEEKQEDFVRATALNFAIALDYNKSINDRKSRLIMVSSYGIFVTVALLAILLTLIVTLSLSA
jgi:hypothetical protein